MPASDKLRAAPTLSTMLMMNDASESSSQLCLDLDEAPVEVRAEEQTQQKMRAQAKSELEKIYKVWNPEKLPGIRLVQRSGYGARRTEEQIMSEVEAMR